MSFNLLSNAVINSPKLTSTQDNLQSKFFFPEFVFNPLLGFLHVTV